MLLSGLLFTPEYVPKRIGIESAIYESRDHYFSIIAEAFGIADRDLLIDLLNQMGVEVTDVADQDFNNLRDSLETDGYIVSPDLLYFSATELQILIDTLRSFPLQWFSDDRLDQIMVGKVESNTLNGVYSGKSGEKNKHVFFFEAGTIDSTIFGEIVTRMCLSHELIHGLINDRLQDLQKEILSSFSSLDNQGERIVFKAKPELASSYLAYGSMNINEFLAVAGSIYTFGPEAFLYVYTPYMGEDEAQLLYDFVKNEIYYGLEYSTGWREQLFKHSPQDIFTLLDYMHSIR